MRTRNILAATFIAATVLTACEKNDNAVNNPDIVQFNSYITPGNLSRANINEYNGTGEFINGDIWGVYATTDGTRKLNNSEYTLGSTTLYWKNLSETAPVTFVAHYPRITETISNPEAYMFNAAKATNPDLLISTPVAKSKGETVTLDFKHVMHQLVITLEKEPDVSGNLSDTEITLLGMKSSVGVNLLTGTVNAASASGTDAYEKKTSTSIWFVAPQSLTPGNDWIRLVFNNKTYTYKVPDNLTQLESSKRMRLSLKFKVGGKVELNQAITEWIDQTTETIYGDATATK